MITYPVAVGVHEQDAPDAPFFDHVPLVLQFKFVGEGAVVLE